MTNEEVKDAVKVMEDMVEAQKHLVVHIAKMRKTAEDIKDSMGFGKFGRITYNRPFPQNDDTLIRWIEDK